MRHMTSIPTRRGFLQEILEGRFSAFAITGFVLLSAGFALATAFSPRAHSAPRVDDRPAEVLEAEGQLEQVINERVYMHLKRAQTR